LNNSVQLGKLNLRTLTHRPCEAWFVRLRWKIQHENANLRELIRVARTKSCDYLSRVVQTNIRAKLNQHSSGHKRLFVTSQRRDVHSSIFLCSNFINGESEGQEHYCAEQKTNCESCLLHRYPLFFKSCRLKPACRSVEDSGR